VNLAARIGAVGVFLAPDRGAKNEKRKQGIFEFPVGEFFDQGLTIGTGQAPVKKYNEYFHGPTIFRRAKPSRTVSHHIRIDVAPGASKKNPIVASMAIRKF
jgi:glutathione-independent formaldehyde dehydrogenase